MQANPPPSSLAQSSEQAQIQEEKGCLCELILLFRARKKEMVRPSP